MEWTNFLANPIVYKYSLAILSKSIFWLPNLLACKLVDLISGWDSCILLIGTSSQCLSPGKKSEFKISSLGQAHLFYLKDGCNIIFLISSSPDPIWPCTRQTNEYQ